MLFAHQGADAVIAYLNEHEDAERTKSLVEQEGCHRAPIAGDLQDEAHCDGVEHQIEANFGRIDILVNDAAYVTCIVLPVTGCVEAR